MGVTGRHARRPVAGIVGNELTYVTDCLTSDGISSEGGYVSIFEERFAAYHRVANALTTSSGTAALHLAITALGIGSDDGDEVILPSFAAGACASAVLHAGATPVLVDVCPDTWTLDPMKVQAAITSSTKAVLAVHIHGHPCDMDAINKVGKERELFIIEDCAAALGARYNGQLVGTLADVACFSFADEVITTGEGGMVLTTNPKLHQKLALARDHFSYRLTNIQAAFGVAQLEKLDGFLRHRRSLARRYREQLRDLTGIHLPKQAAWANSVHSVLTIMVDPDRAGLCRDRLVTGLIHEGIDARLAFPPLHEQPTYPDSNETCPVTDWISGSGLSLPTGNEVLLGDVDRICDVFRGLIQSDVAKPLEPTSR